MNADEQIYQICVLVDGPICLVSLLRLAKQLILQVTWGLFRSWRLNSTRSFSYLGNGGSVLVPIYHNLLLLGARSKSLNQKLSLLLALLAPGF